MSVELFYPKEEYFHPPHSACPGCGIALALRYFLKAMGDEVIFVMPVGCSGVIIHLPTRRIFHGGQMLKVLSVPYGSTATFAGGVKTAIELEGDTITQVVGWAGDGATFDIGFQALSAAAERNENIIYVCCDNEGYMNTGNQRSSASPKNITTSTTPAGVRKAQGKKEIALIMARHKIPYVCTATVAYPNDFMSKVIKAKEIKGFRFFHVLCPCPTGWKYLAQSTVKISRLAVATRVFPLFEAESGDRLTINEEPEKEPLEEYIKLQGRYNDMSLEQIEEYKNEVEERWEFLQRQTRFGEDADGVSNK